MEAKKIYSTTNKEPFTLSKKARKIIKREHFKDGKECGSN